MCETGGGERAVCETGGGGRRRFYLVQGQFGSRMIRFSRLDLDLLDLLEPLSSV